MRVAGTDRRLCPRARATSQNQYRFTGRGVFGFSSRILLGILVRIIIILKRNPNRILKRKPIENTFSAIGCTFIQGLVVSGHGVPKRSAPIACNVSKLERVTNFKTFLFKIVLQLQFTIRDNNALHSAIIGHVVITA